MGAHSYSLLRLEEVQDTIRALLDEQANLTADFEECKSKIFDQQPYTQASGASLQSEYQAIQRGIDEWVYDALADIEKGKFTVQYIGNLNQQMPRFCTQCHTQVFQTRRFRQE